MEPIPDFPGLKSDAATGMFERAYRMPDDRVARARFTPQAVRNEIDANVTPGPRQISVKISVSFVDEEGQVTYTGNVANLGSERSHAWALNGPDNALGLAAWLDRAAAQEALRLAGEVLAWQQADELGLLPPNAA